jgi:hypothetical protein
LNNLISVPIITTYYKNGASEYYPIDIKEVNSKIYIFWAYGDKITVTDQTLTIIINDVQIIPTGRYKDTFLNDPFSTIIANNNLYIAFVSTDGIDMKLNIIGTTASSVTIGLLTTFNTKLTIEDIILDSNYCYIITNDPIVKIIKVDMGNSSVSYIQELYTVTDGVQVLSEYAKMLSFYNKQESINIVKFADSYLLNII